jgi:hypothetical protein
MTGSAEIITEDLRLLEEYCTSLEVFLRSQIKFQIKIFSQRYVF